MERQTAEERRAARLAERAEQESQAAEWIATHPHLVNTAISSIQEDAPNSRITLVEHTEMLDADAAADRTALAEAEATGETYRYREEA